jgi:benzoyl-CoA reductase/2-hydroxyglutaryl-CoA dehydratase subunit BcrC/BadD/HgdB
MQHIDDLMSHAVRRRPAELQGLRSRGTKIIGFPPGAFLPEELIYAAGAVPVCLFHGGDPEAVAASAAFVPRYIDTFCRSQIGYWSLGEDPYYHSVDLFVSPLTDNNERTIADCFDFYTGIEVFRFGVPHDNSDGSSLQYYLYGLKQLKARLEDFTGNRITGDKLKEAIRLYNGIRASLREISAMRKTGAVPLSGRQFITLNHVSYLLDPLQTAASLVEISSSLKQEKGTEKSPRLLFIASTLAFGDYKVLHLIEETGAEVVIEESLEGLRDCRHDVPTDGDPLEALAAKYFGKSLAPAYFSHSYGIFNHYQKLIDDYKVDGVIWYQLMYRETYDMQSFSFSRRLKKLGIPMLKLQSDYDAFETGQFRTRIGAFIEILRSKPVNTVAER